MEAGASAALEDDRQRFNYDAIIKSMLEQLFHAPFVKMSVSLSETFAKKSTGKQVELPSARLLVALYPGKHSGSISCSCDSAAQITITHLGFEIWKKKRHSKRPTVGVKYFSWWFNSFHGVPNRLCLVLSNNLEEQQFSFRWISHWLLVVLLILCWFSFSSDLVAWITHFLTHQPIHPHPLL